MFKIRTLEDNKEYDFNGNPDNYENKKLKGLSFEKNNCHIGVFGQTDSGKSYWLKNVLLNKLKRVVILDRMNEYHNSVNEENTFYHISDFSEAFYDSWNNEYMLKRYVPLDNNEALFYKLCFGEKGVRECRFLQVIAEEVSLDCNKSKFYHEYLKEIVNRGRHKSISLIYTSQRPAQIHNDLINASRIIMTFRQTAKAEFDFFRYYYDDVSFLHKLKQGRKKVVTGQELYTKVINRRYF